MNRVVIYLFAVCMLGMNFQAAWAEDDEAVAACVRAVKAQQPNGADYQPGIDVYGQKVVPADLGSSYQVKPPDVIEFDIHYDAAKRLGMNVAEYYEGQATVAKVRVEGNRLFINGQEVVSSSAKDLIAACRQRSQ